MRTTNTILDSIVAHKLKEIEQRKKQVPLSKLKSKIQKTDFDERSFADALQQKKVSIIAEIKKASPSSGIIKKDFDHVAIAKEYEKAGVSAISILTDEQFFQGNLSFLSGVKKVTSVPLLRKDFIIDTYQVYESKAAGADAILLIASILTKPELESLMKLAGELNMDCLVETHTHHEIEFALACGVDIIGINNRDLRTFVLDLNTFVSLSRFVPKDKILVCESGIFTKEDVKKAYINGAHAALVGTSIMKADNISEKLLELVI